MKIDFGMIHLVRSKKQFITLQKNLRGTIFPIFSGKKLEINHSPEDLANILEDYGYHLYGKIEEDYTKLVGMPRRPQILNIRNDFNEG